MDIRKKFFERLLQDLRLKKVEHHILNNSILLDIGGGSDYTLLKRVKNKIKYGICIDDGFNFKEKSLENIKLIGKKCVKKLNFPKNYFDCIVMTAVLEHLDYPSEILSECYRVLKPNGVLLITTPLPKSGKFISMLANLNLLDKHNVHEHKKLFDKKELIKVLSATGFSKSKMTIEYFELRHNIFAKVIK